MSDIIGTGTIDRLLAGSKYDSVASLAAASGLSHATMIRINRGEDYRASSIKKLADALGIAPSSLLRRLERSA